MCVFMSGAIFSYAAGPIKKCYCKELSQIVQGSKWARKNCQKVAKMAKNANRSMAPCSQAWQSRARRSHQYIYIMCLVKFGRLTLEVLKQKYWRLMHFDFFFRGWGPLIKRTACRSVCGKACGCCISPGQLESANSSSYVASPAGRDHNKQLNNVLVNNKNNNHTAAPSIANDSNIHSSSSRDINNSKTAIKMTTMRD